MEKPARIGENAAMSCARILEWITLSTAFLLPLVFWPSSQQPFSTAKDWLLAVWVIAGFALAIASGRIKQKIPSRAMAAIMVWIIALSLSAGTGDESSIRELVRNLLACAGFLLVLWSGVQPRKFALALVCSGTIVAAIALLQWIGLDPFALLNLTGSLQGSLRIRIFSTLGNPNFVAALLTVLLPLTICIPVASRYSQRTWRILQAAAGFIQVCAIIATGSRAPILGLIAAGIWFLFFNRVKIRLRWLFPVLALCAILIMLSPARPLGTTIAGRIYIWKIAFKHIAEIPPVGFGPGAFALRFAQWETDHIRANTENPELSYSGFQDHAHNDYLEFLVDYGIVGLCAFIVSVGLAAPLLRRRSRLLLEQGIGASIVALMGIAMVDFPLHTRGAGTLLRCRGDQGLR